MTITIQGLDKYGRALGEYLDDLADYAVKRHSGPKRSAKEVLHEVQKLIAPQKVSSLSEATKALLAYMEANTGYENFNSWKQASNLISAIEALEQGDVNYDDVRAEYSNEEQHLIAEAKREAQRISNLLSQAAQRAEVSGPIVLQVTWNKEEPTTGLSMWLVRLGQASFSLYVDEHDKPHVDDLLESGDSDFFSSPEDEGEYFRLIKEIEKPGSSKQGKWVTLYTARPVKDRARYEQGKIPSGIFLASDLYHAAGLASDLGGAETRDLWRMTLNDADMIQTLSGPVRYYQVVRDTKAKRSELIQEGNIESSYVVQASKWRVEEEATGYYKGQLDATLIAIDDKGSPVGYLDYSVYDGRPNIRMVEALIKNQGVGRALVEALAKKYPYGDIDWGYTTPDGTALQRAMDRQFHIKRIPAAPIDLKHLTRHGRLITEHGSHLGSEYVSLYVEFDNKQYRDQFIADAKELGGLDIEVQDGGDVWWVEAHVPHEIPAHTVRGNVLRSGFKKPHDNFQIDEPGPLNIPTPLTKFPKTWAMMAAKLGHDTETGVVQLAPILGGRRRYHHRPLSTWLLSNHLCLTLTTDPMEAKAWNSLVGKNHPAFPKIFSVTALKLSGGDAPKLWAIVHERLFWSPAPDWVMFVDMLFRWRAWNHQAALKPITPTDIDDFLLWLHGGAEESTRKGKVEHALPWQQVRERRKEIAKIREQLLRDSGLAAKVKWAKSAVALLHGSGVRFQDFDPSNLGKTKGGRTVVTNIAESRSKPTRTGRLGQVKSPAPSPVRYAKPKPVRLAKPKPVAFGPGLKKVGPKPVRLGPQPVDLGPRKPKPVDLGLEVPDPVEFE